MILKAIEVNETPDGLIFACYLYRSCGETLFVGEEPGLWRLNAIEPSRNKSEVIAQARQLAQFENVSLINLVDLSASVPLVETLAMMNKETGQADKGIVKR